jgi:signal peptidase
MDFLTKGDNNWGDDRSLYPKGMMWLQPKHVLGRVVGFLPFVGRLTIIMNDYPLLKYVMIGSLGLFVLTSKDDGIV